MTRFDHFYRKLGPEDFQFKVTRKPEPERVPCFCLLCGGEIAAYMAASKVCGWCITRQGAFGIAAARRALSRADVIAIQSLEAVIKALGKEIKHGLDRRNIQS
jgi:hypothetical protein